MTYQATTSLPASEIFARAKSFFAERVPQNAAFPEKEGPTYLTLRGQGGEEVVIAVMPGEGVNRIRGSTLFYDQALERFLSTVGRVEGTP